MARRGDLIPPGPDPSFGLNSRLFPHQKSNRYLKLLFQQVSPPDKDHSTRPNRSGRRFYLFRWLARALGFRMKDSTHRPRHQRAPLQPLVVLFLPAVGLGAVLIPGHLPTLPSQFEVEVKQEARLSSPVVRESMKVSSEPDAMTHPRVSSHRVGQHPVRTPARSNDCFSLDHPLW